MKFSNGLKQKKIFMHTHTHNDRIKCRIQFKEFNPPRYPPQYHSINFNFSMMYSSNYRKTHTHTNYTACVLVGIIYYHINKSKFYDFFFSFICFFTPSSCLIQKKKKSTLEYKYIWFISH